MPPAITPRSTLAEELDALLRQARGGSRTLYRRELEDLYTTGCAEILALEARALRAERHLKAARDEGARAADLELLLAQHTGLTDRLRASRSELRHLRAAIEWLQANPA